MCYVDPAQKPGNRNAKPWLARRIRFPARFISDDWAQRKDLREIAAEARLECEILSFNEFYSGFALVA